MSVLDDVWVVCDALVEEYCELVGDGFRVLLIDPSFITMPDATKVPSPKHEEASRIIAGPKHLKCEEFNSCLLLIDASTGKSHEAGLPRK
jgi:hypothetical protein